LPNFEGPAFFDDGVIRYSNFGIMEFCNIFSSEQCYSVYSVAAFEHVHRLGDCIEKIQQCLRPVGIMCSYFAVCWMSPYGHHWGLQPCPMNEFDHLTLSPVGLYEKFTEYVMTSVEAEKHCYHIYRDPWINRNTHTDYMRAFQRGIYSSRKIACIGLKAFIDLDESIVSSQGHLEKLDFNRIKVHDKRHTASPKGKAFTCKSARVDYCKQGRESLIEQ
jgi:hypothetical protein